MAKKGLGSYRREKQLGLKGKHMKTHTENQDRELAALVQLRDEDIDTSDIPEVRDWRRAVVGKFYRPIKEPVTLRVDADVLIWLKSEGAGYQTRINTLLRAAMVGSPDSGASGEPEAEGEALELASCEFQFPSLEKHGELEKYNLVAEVIEKQHSVFAPTV
jgi:uncharacterized protein (DUF4415 family)